MQARQGSWAWAGCLLSGTLAAGPPTSTMQLPSCVAGSPPLSVAEDAAQARLDAADRLQLHEAAQARYPLYQRGGLAPSDVLLLQRGTQWLYVTLAPLGPRGSCFTAVFAAERFGFTERWLAKYRPRAGPGAD